MTMENPQVVADRIDTAITALTRWKLGDVKTEKHFGIDVELKAQKTGSFIFIKLTSGFGRTILIDSARAGCDVSAKAAELALRVIAKELSSGSAVLIEVPDNHFYGYNLEDNLEVPEWQAS